MAIANPQILEGFDVNQSNSNPPAQTLIDDGYPLNGVPASENHNYMFGNIYNNLNFLKESGLYRWDSNITYKKGALTARDERFYLSLNDGNLGEDPKTSSQWIDFTRYARAPYKTTGVTNAGSTSTVLAEPYFGTATAPESGQIIGIRITTGQIDFPAAVKITIASSTYDLDDTITFSGASSTGRVLEVRFNGTSFNLTLDRATTTLPGITKLSSSTSSTSETEAATASAVKIAKDAADAANANANTRALKTNNLSDLSNVATARTNLSVYSKAETDAKYPTKANNLSDLASATTARTNLSVYSQAEVDQNRKIEAGSDKHSGSIIRHKTIEITLGVGIATATRAHGISGAFDGQKILDVRAQTTDALGTRYVGGENGSGDLSIVTWIYDNTELRITRSSSAIARTFLCYITYV